jgi:hypothetical protein
MTIAGTYRVTVTTPVGPQQGVLTLKVDGHALSGTLASPKGTTEFSGGTAAGDEVHFVAKIKTPIGRVKAQISGRVAGDRFTGQAKLPLGVAQIEGVRTSDAEEDAR